MFPVIALYSNDILTRIYSEQKTENNKCFLWCSLAHLQKVDAQEKQISTHKKHLTKCDTGKKQFPVKIKDIPKLDKPINLNINLSEMTPFQIFVLNYINKNY